MLGKSKNKIEFIEFLQKHKKLPTPNRLAAFDMACKMEGYFSIKELRKELKKTGLKSSTNGVWYWCKLLSWAGVITKVAVEHPSEGLVWRFTTNIEELEEV